MFAKRPPGPSTDWLRQNSRRFNSDPRTFARELHDHYGDVVYLRLGTHNAYYLFYPDHIRELLVTKQKSFRKFGQRNDEPVQSNRNEMMERIGDFWPNNRRQCQPAFGPKQLQQYGQVTLKWSLHLIEQWRSDAGCDRELTVEIGKAMTDLILQISAESLFGTDLGPKAGRVADAIVALTDSHATDRELVRALSGLVAHTSRARRSLSKAVLTDTMHGIIAQYRASGANRGDLLALMLSALDKQGIDVAAQGPALGIPMDPFVAGSETTASAMIWVLYLLASHIEIQEKLQGELRCASTVAYPRSLSCQLFLIRKWSSRSRCVCIQRPRTCWRHGRPLKTSNLVAIHCEAALWCSRPNGWCTAIHDGSPNWIASNRIGSHQKTSTSCRNSPTFLSAVAHGCASATRI